MTAAPMAGAPRRSHALTGFAVSIAAIAVAYASAFLPGGTPAWGPWLLAFGTAGSMVSVMVLGAARPGRKLGILRWVFGATFVIVAGGFGLALSLPAEGPGSTLWLGLPARAAILVYGIGLLPVLFLPVSYAMTFDRIILSEGDLERLREQLALLHAREAAAAAPPGAGAPRAAADRVEVRT